MLKPAAAFCGRGSRKLLSILVFLLGLDLCDASGATSRPFDVLQKSLDVRLHCARAVEQ
jgi:hypothetical protein